MPNRSIHFIRYQCVFLCIATLLLNPVHLFAQQKTNRYSILNRGDTVGQMHITRRIAGDDIFLNASSNVEMRVLISIKVDIQEEAHFINGKLMSSAVIRQVNGKQKANKETKASGDYYTVTDEGKQETLNQKLISYNFIMLYHKEPIGISRIYSDNYQKFFTLQQPEKHVYKIDLPDGNTNTYYYENGVCSKVDVHNPMYNIQMVLNK